MATKICAISGSTRKGSHTKIMVDLAVQAAEAAGAKVHYIDLREIKLPMFEDRNKANFATEEYLLIKREAEWAHGFILGTPEYHGSMSGAMKNWIDYLYEELAGKLAGIVCSAGGGGSAAVQSIKRSFEYCHGFTLPFSAVGKRGDFDDGVITTKRVADRVERLGRDVARYAGTLHRAFQKARKLGKGQEAGFAGFHAD